MDIVFANRDDLNQFVKIISRFWGSVHFI
jgi:hypothetical protein